MDILQAREQKEIVKELEKDIEDKKENLYIIENFVEFKIKKRRKSLSKPNKKSR